MILRAKTRSNGRFAALLLAFSLVVAACSSSEDAAQLIDPADFPNTPEAEQDDSAILTPDGLAFTSGPLNLRVSVPELDVVPPHEVDETNAVQVLIADLLTDGLTRRNDETGSIEPALAESWRTNNSGLVWTFQLGDATFSDGSPVTADDVVASLNRVALQGSASISGPNLWPIVGWDRAGDSENVDSVSGIEAPREDRVRITTTRPFTPLPEILAAVSFGVLPADAADGENGDLPLSSAIDFTPTERWEDGLRLEREAENGIVSKIELFVDPQLTMLQAGETDLAVAVDVDEPLEGATNAAVPRSAETYFAMNALVSPLDDVMIRQAIVHAIDAEQIRDTFFPNAEVMRNFIPEDVIGGVRNACATSCEFNPSQARTLVQASPSRNAAFTVDYVEIDPREATVDKRIAERIAATLNEIGLSAEAVRHTPEEFEAAASAGELGLFRFGSASTTLSAETDLGLSFHGNGRDNVTGTSIPRVNTLINEARETMSEDERAQHYSEAESILFAEAVVLPLVQFNHQIAFGATLDAAGLEPDGSLDLSEMRFAPVEAPDEPILDGE